MRVIESQYGADFLRRHAATLESLSRA